MARDFLYQKLDIFLFHSFIMQEHRKWIDGLHHNYIYIYINLSKGKNRCSPEEKTQTMHLNRIPLFKGKLQTIYT